jgi:hypothetical protein
MARLGECRRASVVAWTLQGTDEGASASQAVVLDGIRCRWRASAKRAANRRDRWRPQREPAVVTSVFFEGFGDLIEERREKLQVIRPSTILRLF